MPRKITNIIFLIFFSAFTFSQSEFRLIDSKKDKIKFELINNLIVIPVEVNGVELTFLLDSGVSKPILFNIINLSDSLKIKNLETVYIRGLGGEGSIAAMKSKNNVLKIGDAINVSQEIYVVFDENINFTPRLGIPIHGIIGYDLLKDFIVEINYSAKFIKLHIPTSYKYRKCRGCESFDLHMSHNKPYIDGTVIAKSQEIPVKLLIDTGGSDALWLFEDRSKGLLPQKNNYFEDYLGKGLSGSVYGKRSKLKSFSLKSFDFEDVNVAFPDSTSISIARNFKERSGSISGEILKRFNMIVDYGNEKITLKRNANFNEPFYYNKSGIILEQNGIRLVKEEDSNFSYNRSNDDNGSSTITLQPTYHYSVKPAYSIVELREGSPAERAGLMIGDVILVVNNKNASNLKMQAISEIFSDKDGKLVKIKIERNGVILDFQFRLENLF